MVEFPIHGSKWFDVREFVHPKVWETFGVACCEQIDERIVRIADLLRELSGAPVMVNNWHYARRGEKVYRSSGYRATWDPTGAKYSQHRAGRAADFKIKGWTPIAMLRLVTDNLAAFVEAGLTTVEDIKITPTWLHLDCRARCMAEDKDGLRIVGA